MKKITFLFALFFVIISINAQSTRAIYEYKYVRDSIANKAFTTTVFLDLNTNNVKFYYQELYKMDSTKKATGKSNVSMSIANSVMVKRNLNSNTNENYIFVDTDYYSYPSEDKMNWNILPDTKKFKEYTLQKATTNFGGRKWIAWFSKDVPINQGPFKFQGLPGLIFQIEDEKKYFSFNLIEIKKLPEDYDTSGFLESNFGKKAIPVTFKKYNEILWNAYDNPFSEIRTKLARGEDYTFSAYGRDIKSVKDLDEVRKTIQADKRKYNNPIEIDKALKYKE